VVQACNLAGIDVFTPGETELGMGLETLEPLLREARFTVLAANLVRAADGVRPFGAVALRELAGWKVGLLGIVGQRLERVDPGSLRSRGFELLPPLPVVRGGIDVLRQAGAELVVLVAHMEQQELTELLEQLGGGIHVAVLGHERSRSSFREQIGQTVVIGGGLRGSALGQLRLTLRGRPVLLRDEARSSPARTQLAQVDTRLAALQRTLDNLPAEGTITSPDQLAERRTLLTEALTREQTTKRQLEEQIRLTEQHPVEPSSYSYREVRLESHLAEDPEVRQLLAQGHQPRGPRTSRTSLPPPTSVTP